MFPGFTAICRTTHLLTTRIDLMKNTLRILLLATLSSTVANAASISLSNYSTTNSIFQPILDESQSVVSTGILLIGTFASDPTTAEDVLGTGFTPTDGSISFSNGYFLDTINTQTLTDGDAFVGNPVYVVIGNGTTLANSTLIGVWKATSNSAGNTFTADDPTGGPDTISVFAEAGSVLIGNQLTAHDNSQNIAPAFQLVAVPEPSAMLLSVVGALVLMRRRR